MSFGNKHKMIQRDESNSGGHRKLELNNPGKVGKESPSILAFFYLNQGN